MPTAVQIKRFEDSLVRFPGYLVGSLWHAFTRIFIVLCKPFQSSNFLHNLALWICFDVVMLSWCSMSPRSLNVCTLNVRDVSESTLCYICLVFLGKTITLCILKKFCFLKLRLKYLTFVRSLTPTSATDKCKIPKCKRVTASVMASRGWVWSIE